jgi:drug/metabolite transporter (DMT)-like permease
MFERLPVQVWLLLLIGLFSWPAILTVARRIQKSELDSYRPGAKQAAIAFAALVLALALAIFIFTPQAKAFAHSPQFLPILFAGLTAFTICTTAQGFLSGSVEPLTRGSLGPYSRVEHPRRYWASQVWNVTVSAFMIWLLFKI